MMFRLQDQLLEIQFVLNIKIDKIFIFKIVCVQLQEDLNSLERCEKQWHKRFKCHIMHVTRKRAPFITKYTLNGPS